MTRERPQGEPDMNPARIAHLIEIARLSRASYYRWLEPKLTRRDDADLRDLIQFWRSFANQRGQTVTTG